MNIHSSVVCDRQNMETVQMSINIYHVNVLQQILYPYDEILLDNEKKICWYMHDGRNQIHNQKISVWFYLYKIQAKLSDTKPIQGCLNIKKRGELYYRGAQEY